MGLELLLASGSVTGCHQGEALGAPDLPCALVCLVWG